MAATQKINAPSFKATDIYSVHRLMAILGTVLSFAGILIVAAASVAYTQMMQAKETTGVANNMLAEFSAPFVRSGSAADLQTASLVSGWKKSQAVSDSFYQQELPFLFGEARVSYSALNEAWSGVAENMRPFSVSSSEIGKVQEALAAQRPLLNNLAHSAEYLKRVAGVSPGWLSAYSVATNRLFAYSEGRFGYDAIPKIDYDVKTLVYAASQLGATGNSHADALTSGASTLSSNLSKLLESASANTPDTAALKRLAHSLHNLSGAIEYSKAAIAQALATTWVLLVAGVIASVLGIVILIGGIFSAMRDFENRFRRSANQFRKSEVTLDTLVQQTKMIAQGDLSLLELDPSDPKLFELGTSVNTLCSTISEMVLDIRSLTAEAQNRSIHITESTAEATSLLSRQQAGLNEAVQLLGRVGRLVKDMELDSTSASFAAQTVVDAVQNGAQAVMDAVENMDAIRGNIHDTSKHIKRLGERSQEIGAIVEILSQLSEQINILALNASLEAERAGDQGRGFAVVATEVRRLSSRADEALQGVSSLVQSMQMDTRAAIDSMEATTNKVIKGAHVTGLAGTGLDVIRSVTATLSGMVNGITGATETQSARAHEVASTVEDIVHISTEVSKRTATIHQQLTDSLPFYADLGDLTRRFRPGE